ncbi:TetR family transcriptional regulator [Saccharomonospora sp. CUA-673]|uniref:TetR/AcrR family transcriptional regulator n=1 Tax=Saccharomonospora sp. CUA-673 TaxID=1904969 RepID=UPI00096287D9|nr:TetR/AcrR family transcriptional regulator [Saccharomonospora sp. CUA-673]OLT39956.1 TetR family transcriptional regulator [Saccharomonospora sp. CUA-673]
MPANQTRRRHRRITARQQALLADLEALFLSDGFLDYTLDDLAARLRCSKSTLYALASSKEQLAVKVVTHFFRGAAERIEERIAEAVDAPATIREYLAGVADELGRASDRFIADVDAFEPTRATYRFNSHAAAARIREFIAAGAADGVFRDVHGPLVAEFAELLIEQIQNGTVRERTGSSDADAFAALSDLLLGGLRADGEQAKGTRR